LNKIKINSFKYNKLCLGKKQDFLKSRKTIAFNYKIIGYMPIEPYGTSGSGQNGTIDSKFIEQMWFVFYNELTGHLLMF